VRLVGEGLRNDAIARQLFIAPGTVKVHLSHIFAKLGITTRPNWPRGQPRGI
jgi:DNA-binding NarL/FixJ family response regulator